MFASSWPRVVAALSALVFGTLLGASLLVAPSASAVDPLPLVGTAECDNAVDGADEVIAAQADLDVAVAAANDAVDALDAALAARDDAAAVLDGVQVGDVVPPGATEALNDAVAALEAAVTANDDAQDRLLDAQAALANARGTALGSLCTTQVGDGTPKPTNPVVTPAPSTKSPAPSAGDDAEALFARISGQIRGLSCDAYNRELGAIGDVLLAPNTSAVLGGEGVGALQDQLNARNRALNFCSNPAPVPATSPSAVVVELDPLADDGSVADTDGTQITIVPAGSASTGAA